MSTFASVCKRLSFYTPLAPFRDLVVLDRNSDFAKWSRRRHANFLGSPEFFPREIKNKTNGHPGAKLLIFCDGVFSGVTRRYVVNSADILVKVAEKVVKN